MLCLLRSCGKAIHPICPEQSARGDSLSREVRPVNKRGISIAPPVPVLGSRDAISDSRSHLLIIVLQIVAWYNNCS